MFIFFVDDVNSSLFRSVSQKRPHRDKIPKSTLELDLAIAVVVAVGKLSKKREKREKIANAIVATTDRSCLQNRAIVKISNERKLSRRFSNAPWPERIFDAISENTCVT